MNQTTDSPVDFASISARTGLGEPALKVLYESLIRGRGTQAQFNHPDLGGAGQWMGGGMIMIGDMFNSALSAKVAAACALLAEAAAHAHPTGEAWWPSGLGAPASVAAQDRLSYALFPNAHRLVVRTGNQVCVYDVSGARVHGVGMQSGRIVVNTSDGTRPLADFPRVP